MDQRQSVRYEIHVRGLLSDTLLAAFGGLGARGHGGETILFGALPDQAALHGVLAQIEALGLELLEVRRVRSCWELEMADSDATTPGIPATWSAYDDPIDFHDRDHKAIRRRSDDRRSAAAVRIWGALAFLVCLVGFVAIAFLVSRHQIPPIDTATTVFLHGLASPTLDALMDAATFLGSSPVLAAVVGLAAVLLVLRRRRAEAVFVVLALIGTLVLNDVLKSVVQRPRPGFDWAEVWPETGFPSGHSMNSFVVYVALALVIWRIAGRRVGTMALALALVLAVSIGISRIYLGAHWLTDVIGGYLAGALWLLLLVAASAGVSRLSRREGLIPAASGRAATRPDPTRPVTPMGPERRP